MRSPAVVQVLCLFMLLLLAGCASNDLGDITIDCSQSTLKLSLISTTDATTCIAGDGSLTVTASGGVAPYNYSLGGTTNSTGNFNVLTAGNYEVKAVDDNSCERSIIVQVMSTGSNLSMTLVQTSDTECLTNNGSITAAAIDGLAPYEFRIIDEPFGSTPVFTGLKPNTYSIEVRDSQGCTFVKSISVTRGNTGVSFENQIQPIINTKCAIIGCHNGDNGANRNFTVLSNVQASASNIKIRTGNRSMPTIGSLTQNEIDLIACWVDDGAADN